MGQRGVVRGELEYFDDRVLETKTQWEKKQNYDQSVEELVQLVFELSKEGLVETAARLIVQSPGVETALAGYKHDRAADFEELVRNDAIRAFCRERGIL